MSPKATLVAPVTCLELPAQLPGARAPIVASLSILAFVSLSVPAAGSSSLLAAAARTLEGLPGGGSS